MFNYKIRENFVLWEFFKTNQGLLYECGQVADYAIILRNIILSKQDFVSVLPTTKNLMALSFFLQCFRDAFNQPIIINSGFRTNELNKKVHGKENSKHLLGLAVDITFSGYQTYLKPTKFGTPSKIVHMCDFLKDKKNTGVLSELIFHDNYIHLAL